jgi:Tol biopolymer transport system component
LAIVLLSHSGCGGSDSSPVGPPAPAPGALTAVSGDRQNGFVNRQLGFGLTIRVDDKTGRPLAGVTVTWVILSGGGSVTPSGPTASDGVASGYWTLGPAPGEYTVEASIAGVTPVRFSASSVVPGSGTMAVEVMPGYPSVRPTEIYVMNPDGTNPRNITNHPADDGDPAWSPDRTRIAFKTNRDGNFEIYVINVDGTGLARLTNYDENDTSPQWSPDGTRIAFVRRSKGGDDGIFVMKADGTQTAELTIAAAADQYPAWSPDGSKIAFQTNRFGGGFDIAVMNADGTAVTRLTNDPADDWEPAWSPDGTKLAFSTARFGAAIEIAVMNADGSVVTRLATHPGNENDYAPAWSLDGARIAYVCWRRRSGEIFSEVCSMNPDGSGEVRLTLGLPWASWPGWLK